MEQSTYEEHIFFISLIFLHTKGFFFDNKLIIKAFGIIMRRPYAVLLCMDSICVQSSSIISLDESDT